MRGAFSCVRNHMAKLTRREAREIVVGLLFEMEFQTDVTPEAMYSLAMESREFPDDTFVRGTFFGVLSHLNEIDETIGRFSSGWKTGNLSRVTRAILRLSVYEILFSPDVPAKVSINEAMELIKKYDEDKVFSFVNGVLNSVMKENEAHGS